MAEKDKEIPEAQTYRETIIIQRRDSAQDNGKKRCDGGRILLLARGNQYCCYDPAITVYGCTSDTIYRVYPCEIIYIGIENRKCVLHLINKEIETGTTISYWKSILDESAFAQPHYSYIVNLNYVSELSRDYVKLTYGDREYSVYTSSRKLKEFRSILLNFNGYNQ